MWDDLRGHSTPPSKIGLCTQVHRGREVPRTRAQGEGISQTESLVTTALIVTDVLPLSRAGYQSILFESAPRFHKRVDIGDPAETGAKHMEIQARTQGIRNEDVNRLT